VAGKSELSPINKKLCKKIDEKFRVYIFFEDFCTTCNSY